MKKLAVANGSYQKDGQAKTRWVNVGIVNTTQDGKEYMLIDPTINFAAFPREEGKDMVMVGMFEEKNSNQNNQQQQNHQAPQQQSYQQPMQQQQVPTVYKNQDGKFTDERGNILPNQHLYS